MDGESQKTKLELYVHVPFCVKKCAYCDFLSFPSDEELRERYVQALCEEIRRTAERDRMEKSHGSGRTVSSIFFGGGTPSVLSETQMDQILGTIRRGYSVDADAEISAEANPGTLSEGKLACWRDCGINRLSIGCQSASDTELKLLGRIHTFREFLETYDRARRLGYTNINVDLISALPGQTPKDWIRNLETIAGLAPEHISAYSLILEPGTPFYHRYAEAQENPALPGEEEERRMYEDTKAVLAGAGYHRYEISNYAKDGRECRHNIGYWTGVPYRGFGLGASSYFGETRYKNTDSMAAYLNGCNAGSGRMEDLVDTEILTIRERMAEFMILGLRMTRGISETEFRNRFGISFMDQYGAVFEKYHSYGLMDRKDGRIFLTDDGLSLSNTIMAEFL